MSKTYVYIRVSTEQQADSGLGLEAQLATIADYCEKQGLPFDPKQQALGLLRRLLDKSDKDRADIYVHLQRELGLYVDVESAKHKLRERRAGRQMCLDAGAGDHIVIAKLDRAFRNTLDCCEMFEKLGALGVNLHIVDLGGMSINFRTAIGRMILTIMAAVAEFEREMIGQRTREGLAASKRRGTRAGPWAPTGFKWRSTGIASQFKLIPFEPVQELIRFFKRLHFEEDMPFHTIWQEHCFGVGKLRKRVFRKHRRALARAGEYRVSIVQEDLEWTPDEIRRVVLGIRPIDQKMQELEAKKKEEEEEQEEAEGTEERKESA